MNRPFGFGWIWALATLVIASVVGVIAFIAGHATEVATTNDVGRAVNDGYYYGHGFGFFPFFGFLWFLLIVFVLFAVFRRGFGWKRGYWGGGPGGPGGYWHQHTHEPGGPAAPTTPTTPTTPPAGGEPEQPKGA